GASPSGRILIFATSETGVGGGSFITVSARRALDRYRLVPYRRCSLSYSSLTRRSRSLDAAETGSSRLGRRPVITSISGADAASAAAGASVCRWIFRIGVISGIYFTYTPQYTKPTSRPTTLPTIKIL